MISSSTLDGLPSIIGLLPSFDELLLHYNHAKQLGNIQDFCFALKLNSNLTICNSIKRSFTIPMRYSPQNTFVFQKDIVAFGSNRFYPSIFLRNLSSSNWTQWQTRETKENRDELNWHWGLVVKWYDTRNTHTQRKIAAFIRLLQYMSIEKKQEKMLT